MPPVTLEDLAPDRRPLVDRFWQLYRHDLSEFRDSRPDEQGLYPAGRLEEYVGDETRRCLVVRTGQGPAGFVLLRGLGEGETRVMGEFFVVRHYRGSGVGRAAALEVLRRWPGTWAIAFQEENPAAARFWRRLAADVGGNVVEERRPVPDKPWIPPDVWLTLVC